MWGHPDRLRWCGYSPVTCPVPSQPGVGHLISRFSALEESKHTTHQSEGVQEAACWVARTADPSLWASREESGQPAESPRGTRAAQRAGSRGPVRTCGLPGARRSPRLTEHPESSCAAKPGPSAAGFRVRAHLPEPHPQGQPLQRKEVVRAKVPARIDHLFVTK